MALTIEEEKELKDENFELREALRTVREIAVCELWETFGKMNEIKKEIEEVL